MDGLRWLARLPATIRRWLKPPRILRPTRPGWLFLLIILGVGFAALNTGNNLLYLVLSLMLSFLVLSGVMSESALRGITVRRRLPGEVFAGRENAVQVEITNDQRRMSAYAVAVEDRVASGPDGRRRLLEAVTGLEDESEKARGRRRRRRRRRDEGEAAGRSFALRIAPGETVVRHYGLSPRDRGPLAFTGFRVSTRFPFGLFLKYREFDAPDEALVYPEIRSVHSRPRLEDAPASGHARRTRLDQGGTVAGLREFAEGDSVRRVHWPSSLRRGQLLVGETEDDRDAEVEVRLRGGAGSQRRVAASREGVAPPRRARDRFEQAVSGAASEVVAHLQAGLAVALRTDGAYLPPDAGRRQRARLLSFLARVGPDGRGPEEAAP